MNHLSTCAVAVFLLPSWAWAAPDFSSPPQVSDLGDRLRLTFAVTEYTDVTVEILDSGGKRLRALAAGKLGPNAPGPFQANSLSQTLFWDKKTDSGQAAPEGARFRVGLGLLAKFDRIYDANGKTDPVSGTNSLVRGAAVDEQGNVYFLNSSSFGHVRLRAYDRENRYLRTLAPLYPGDLPEEKLKGFGRIELQNGKHMPVVYQGHTRTLELEVAGLPRQGMTTTPQGWLAMVNAGHPWYVSKQAVRRVLIIGLDGSCPRATLAGPVFPWAAKYVDGHPGERVCLAVSPDGKHLYATGAAGHHSVAKSLLDFDGKMDLFLGEDATPGADDAHLNNPRGVATDKAGNIYVSDFGNNRIIVFSPEGIYVAQAPCTAPDQLKVHPRTGEVYVLSEITRKSCNLTKYSGLPKPAAIVTAPVPMDAVGAAFTDPVLALDSSAAKPMLWVGGLQSQVELVGYEDQGDKLVPSAKKIGGAPTGPRWPAADSQESPRYITVDPEEKVLYTGGARGGGAWARVDLATGTLSPSKVVADDAEFGPDGFLYAQRQNYKDQEASCKLLRYNPMGEQIPFANGEMEFKARGGTFYFYNRGFAVARNGDFYFMHTDGKEITKLAGPTCVSVYGPDGQLKKDKVVVATCPAASLRTDNAGNIYLSANIRPKGVAYPSIYQGPFFPDPLKSGYTWPWGHANFYLFYIGCVFKFPPTGGEIRLEPKTTVKSVPLGNLDRFNVPEQQVGGFYDYAYRVTGPVWQYHGISPSSIGENWGDDMCSCLAQRFSVDDFGMTYLPDAMSFSVMILDANKNEILRFGEYGNPDQEGTGSRRPVPDIPLAWPMFVTKVNNSVYVSDPGNRRIVKVKLDYSKSWSSK